MKGKINIFAEFDSSLAGRLVQICECLYHIGEFSTQKHTNIFNMIEV